MLSPKFPEYLFSNYSQVLIFCRRYVKVPVLGNGILTLIIPKGGNNLSPPLYMDTAGGKDKKDGDEVYYG